MQLRRRPQEPQFNLATQDRWGGRAERAVAMWQDHAPGGDLLVADLGAGNGRVRKLITRPATSYLAYDVLPQYDVINQLDLRQGLPGLTVDAAFLLGVIEYIDPSDPLVERLAGFARQAVVSYVTAGLSVLSLEKRVELGWQRHETAEQTKARFASAGYRLIDQTMADDEQTTIWLWELAT